MFLTSGGRSLHIINTDDRNGHKVRISIIRYMNELYISVDPGHFTSMPPVPDITGKSYNPELIDVRGLFTPQIEDQVDLAPLPGFFIHETYDIVVEGYRGTLTVCRGHVSIYLITGTLPPAPPAPHLALYHFAGIVALVLICIVVVLKRKILKRWFV